ADADAGDPDGRLVVEAGDILEVDVGGGGARLLPDGNVLDLHDEEPEEEKDEDGEGSDLGGGRHRLTSSPTSSLFPVTNAFTRGSSDASNSFGGASTRIFPSSRRATRSAISNAALRSCVMVTAVGFSFERRSLITFTMTSVVTGSRPVVGSSKRRIDGESA